MEELVERVLDSGATRASCVVAVGGGVVGNVAGMVAALLFRGIRLAHVPTTLVALLDSVISLKQAVNASCGKNLVGTYYGPVCVFGDTSFLDTLPNKHFRSGLCEVIKNALVIDPTSISYILEHLEPPNAPLSRDVLRELIRMSVCAKLKVMCNDKRERHGGLVLEYGHTVGHAIELETGLSHGESVGLGMLVAAQIGYNLFGLSGRHRDLHHELLARVDAPLHIPVGVCANVIMDRVRSDNKRGLLGPCEANVPMVVLRAPGCPVWTGSLPVCAVPLDVVVDALEYVETGGSSNFDNSKWNGVSDG